VNTKLKSKGGDGGQRGSRLPHPTFALCLLPFAFCLLFASPGVRERSGVSLAPPSEDEIDARLQRAAESSLGGRDGVVLVIDAQTGRVRAAVNQRAAFGDATPPGSAVKPFTMLAALRSGSLDDATRVACRGRYKREDFKITCAHPRYAAPFGPAQALANSCNYFFARAAEALDPEAYTRTLSSFGFGSQTRGGADYESAGRLPRARPGVPEMLGDSDELRVTPAQLVTAYAALFNGGRLLAPRRAAAEGFEPSERARLQIEPAHRALILEGMRGAVAYGTAARAGLATLPLYVFGKTGTSTPPDDWHSQGWFVGFAAGENAEDGSTAPSDAAPPAGVRLAVLVFLKRSRGAEAAELSRPVFEAYAAALARTAETRLASKTSEDESSDEDESSEASPSSSDDEPTGETDGGGGDGPKVRVRLTRGDATLALPLEDYVFGVLAAEGSVESEPEALKALAVVARTYALKNLRRHARDRFDLCDTTHCERFLLVRDESVRPDFYALAHRAVRETAGEVIRDARGRTAEVYFSAACGGRTADVSSLWGVRDPPAHLRGVEDDACDALEEGWTDVITSAQLLRALRADARSDVGSSLDDVRVTARDHTGRAEFVTVEGERRRRLSGWDFKIIVGRTLGWSLLKSSRFEVTRAGSSYVFRGRGFGHGLGLCQTGAHVSAARGAAYRQILSRYFPGTTVVGFRNVERQELRNADSGLRIDDSGAVRPSSTPSSDSFAPDDEHAGALVRTARFVSTSYQPADFESQPATDSDSSVSLLPILNPKSAFRNRSNPQSAIRSQIKSEHFHMSYPRRTARGEAESFLRGLESARADVVRRVERARLAAGLPELEVFVHETTGDFTGSTGQPAWVAAVTTGARMEFQPIEVLRRRGALATTPRHELVHAALESLGRGRAPLWLVEGLAAYVAGEGLRLARAGGARRIPTDELERRLSNPGSAEETRALYAAAYAEVAALIRREGEAAAWRLAAR
jgi:SpoIID/LytB domain protein